MDESGFISAFGGGRNGVIDPTWIAAGSQVLGKALSPAAAGPSSADSGGWIQFGDSPFVVTTGGGGAASAAVAGVPGWIWILGVTVAGVVAWKLYRKT